MAKSVEKNKEPRPIEIVIAAFLSVIVGVVGAVAFLLFQPAEKVTELPEEDERALGRIYYLEGKTGGAAHDTWLPKRAAIETGRSGRLTLVEEELNRWAAQNLKEGEEEVEKGFISVQPGIPGFRIADDIVTVRVPLTWTAFGSSRTFDSQTSGQFVQRGNAHVLDYDRVYIGSCPLPGFLANRLVRDITAAYDVSDELRSGWAALETVEVDGDSLTLLIP